MGFDRGILDSPLTPEEWVSLNEWYAVHKAEIETQHRHMVLSYDAMNLHYRGSLRECHAPLFDCSEHGEHYVYMWKHNGGIPFYIGSGVRGRATSIASRGADFHRELSKADNILWYIVEGVSDKLARRIERYCSVYISSLGYRLINKDFNIRYMSAANLCVRYDEMKAEWFASEISDRLTGILESVEVDPTEVAEIQKVF